jgi:hypothetical protein
LKAAEENIKEIGSGGETNRHNRMRSPQRGQGVFEGVFIVCPSIQEKAGAARIGI